MNDTPPDVVVELEGNASALVLLRGDTDAGTAWLFAHMPAGARRRGGRVACERHHVADTVNRIVAAGLGVATEDVS